MSIYSNDPFSWLEYAKSLDQEKDVYASFMIMYVALAVYCNNENLYTITDTNRLVEIDPSRIEKRFIARYAALEKSSVLKQSVDEYWDFFSSNENLKYPTYPGSGRLHHLDYDRRWKDLGNVINYAKIVRNNLVHGGKGYDADAHSRDYQLVKIARNIVLGLFEDLFKK